MRTPSIHPLGAALLLLITGFNSSADQNVIELFNGQDLSGFTVGGANIWVVENGILKNTTATNEANTLRYSTNLPSLDFFLEMRVKIIEGTRFRWYLEGDRFYAGNEGSIRQFEVYGSAISGTHQVGNDSYVLNQWYDLRIEVNLASQVSLYKNGVLTHTAQTTPLIDLHTVLKPGDSYSVGRIEVSEFRYGQLSGPSVPVEWPVENGGNGHYYEYVSLGRPLTWNDAKAQAEARSYLGAQGHLATVVSADEQAFLATEMPVGAFYLGGYQDTSAQDYSEPSGGWRWITGEPFSYTSWYPNEPNDTAGSLSEEYLSTLATAGLLWNDDSGRRDIANPRGYIVEYPVPEPSATLLLIGSGCAWLLRRRR